MLLAFLGVSLFEKVGSETPKIKPTKSPCQKVVTKQIGKNPIQFFSSFFVLFIAFWGGFGRGGGRSKPL
jgi:hypothetical protein